VSGHGAHAARAASHAPGRHLLARRFARELVDDARVAAGERVVDLGAGTGLLTALVRRRGARVLAVELDEPFADALERRFRDDPGVTIVRGDATVVALPAAPFRVVANLPFAKSGVILDRLLDPAGAMVRADVVLEWAMARKRSEVWPSTCRGVLAAATFDVRTARRLPAGCFEPPPRVDAAVLVVERRPEPLIGPAEWARFARLVRTGFSAPRLSAALRDEVAPRRLRRLADGLAFRRDAAARDLDWRQWVALHRELQGPR
jgi:23S rRNA (adenine-N6)-dimethyltransferase